MNRVVFRSLYWISTLLVVLSCQPKGFPHVADNGKESYLDIMQKSVDAYSDSAITAYIDKVNVEGIKEHGFARLTANIGILLSQGRIPERRETFVRMMDICAREMPVALKNNNGVSVGNDFSVKEICCCLYELERSEIFSQDQMRHWQDCIRSMRAEDIYTVQPVLPSEKAYNWCVFGSASECARLMTGLGGDRSYADRYFEDQLRYFDENGMYRDPHQPIVYDIVTRLQFMAALEFGYDGPARESIEEQLLKSALPTLWMQTAAGEIPFGGRSNQFLHNDSFYAAVFEYYATWMKKRGDMEMASRFKAAAIRARESLEYWLSQEPVRHIKNHYPLESGYGCEVYAYFNKYMVTTASWAYLAWRFADDSIIPATTTEPSHTFVSSDDFHIVVMNAGGYTVQFDTNANEYYDSNGIGKIQKRGAPSVIAMASPCPSVPAPNYQLDIHNPGPLALSPLWEKYVVVSSGSGKIVLSDGGDSRWICSLSRRGLKMTVRQKGDIKISVPAFSYDGEKHTDILCDGEKLEIRYEGKCCLYTTDGKFVDSGLTYANRSGHFRRFDVVGSNRVRLNCKIY